MALRNLLVGIIQRVSLKLVVTADDRAQHVLAMKAHLALQLQPVPFLIEKLRIRVPVASTSRDESDGITRYYDERGLKSIRLTPSTFKPP